MKKILFSLVVLAALAVQADSYLYWMVGEGSLPSGYSYTSARVVATEGSYWATYGGDNFGADRNLLNIYGGSGAEISTTDLGTARDYGGGVYSILGEYASGYTYYIELLNDNNVIAVSESGLQYANAANYISSLTAGDPGARAVWFVPAGSFSTAPEPNSAMLIMLGMAALGLKRRRV